MSNDDKKKEQVVSDRMRGILSGTSSGVAKLVVGHPFDTIKVRMQTEGSFGRFKGPIHCLLTTVKTEGIKALYKGATPPLFGWAVIDSVMVGTYAATKNRLQQNQPNPLSIPQCAFAGMIGGWASVIVVTPIEQVKARLQVQYADPSSKIYKGPIDCVVKLVKNNRINDAFFGLYKGFWGTVMFRTFCSVYFGSYEYFKRSLSSSTMPVMLQNFISGGSAATALWLVSYPFDLVKNRMMAQADTVDRPYKTVKECFQKIYAKEGLKGFYRGFSPCLLRSFPTNGAAFVAIELTIKLLP